MTGSLQANDISLQGIWQIVELVPTGNNPLKDIDAYYVFMPNGTMIDVSIPKDNKSPTETKTYKYNYKDGILTIIRDKDISEHKIKKVGSRVKMDVPFGAIWLQKIPNN
jgi:hypothetical protein